MRRRRGEVFLIGQERMLDEEGLGLELPAEADPEPESALDTAAAIDTAPVEEREEDDEPIHVTSRKRKRPRVPVDHGRWIVRGGAIGSTLIVAVLMVVAFLRGGGEERRAPVVARAPRERVPVDSPDGVPKAWPGRERSRDAAGTPPRPEREPRRAEEPREGNEGDEPSPADPTTTAPVSDAELAPAAGDGSVPVGAPAATPTDSPTPTPSDDDGWPAVASASEVRQEFGP